MVREIDADDGSRYQCEECGSVFDDEDEAEGHEADCYVPPSM